MRLHRRIAVLGAIVLIAAGCGSALGQPVGSSGGLVSIGAGLNGPAGLKATVYATGLPKVSALAVDSLGRLWVATADATDHGQDGIYVVPKAGATPVEVVAGLHTPLGLLWYQDSLYVASSGRVDAFSHFDGTTFATRRTVVTLPAGTGEVNEIVVDPDGNLFMGISAPCDHCTPTSKWSASIVSLRPDGTDLKVVAKGIRAPVGLAWYPGTDDLLASMDQRDDLGAATPGDWLAVVKPGQDWGFPGCYGQPGVACTGAPQPVAVLDKHAGVSGVAIVTGQLGAVVGNSALVAEWALGTVQHVTLTKTGAGYTGSVTPFLTGLKNPVPVVFSSKLGLLVGDWTTGTVYLISQARG